MKHIILCAFAALALSACKTTPDNSDMMTTTDPTPEPIEKVCPIENPDGTCACEEVDEFGDCVEGGGSGVIIPGGGSGVIIPGGGSGVIIPSVVSD